ncbi:hypothetical protein BN1044_00398 [Hafnia alvei]|uniref:Uncharacterized protein n=1 Tax=Hafnia alvei TaxID=569 RepID=A0A1C6YVX7_HAFAL|nr:hypothetical protein BN1044_00398 [Hafnia alvei]
MSLSKKNDNYINFEDLELQLSGLHIDIGVKKKELKEHQKSARKLKHRLKKY